MDKIKNICSMFPQDVAVQMLLKSTAVSELFLKNIVVLFETQYISTLT